MLHDLVAGQNADLRLSQLPPGEASVAEWELMAEQKSGALIGAAMALGALAGGADEQVADAFDRCGRVLGVAYQVADDVLAVWGDAAVTGKPTAVQPSARLYPLVASGGRLAETSDPAAPCRELLEGTPAREACSSAVARLTDEGLALLADVPDAGGVGSRLQAMLAALANRSS